MRTRFLLAILALLPACGPEAAPTGAERPAPERAPDAPPVRVLGQVPNFELTDQAGAAFRLTRPSGTIWVVNFIFTRCGGTCPVQTRNLHALQERVHGDPAWRAVRFVSITVDPGYDTPEVLSGYARTSQADPERWTFLTGDREAIWTLSKAALHLDVRDAADDPDMPIFHSTKMVLIDSLGQIRGYYEGTTEEGAVELARDVAAVASEPRHAAAGKGVLDAPALEERARAQIEQATSLAAFHDFSFTDRRPESGITFVHRVTPDAGKKFKFVHYDHGNGLPAADVDGDGRIDLFFLNQVGPNELWRNVGGGRFEDITAASGLALDDRICVTATFCDIDNDGDPDVYVTSVLVGNLLFENDGKGRFTDITEGSGLGVSAHSSSPVFFDYDRDGLVDVFLTNVGDYTVGKPIPAGVRADGTKYTYYEGREDAFSGHIKPERTELSRLYRNLGGGRFEDVTDAAGIAEESWAGDATPIDVNEDGWPDLYVLDMQGQDDYWENVEGKRFVNKGREVFPSTPWGAMGVKAFDFDGDEHLDLFVTDMHSDMAEDVGPELEKKKSAAMEEWPESLLRSAGLALYGNALFVSGGDGTFSEVSDAVGAENYWPWGLSVADLNADGHEDAFITASMGFYFRYHPNSLLLNDGGRRFVDAEFVLGAEPRRDGRTAKRWFDMDAEGADADHVLVGQPGIFGRMALWDALGSRASVIYDLDDDGDLDIVTSDFGSEPMVLISDLSARQPQLAYLKVRLVGTKSNRDGLGARVTVVAGGRRRVQVHDGKSGYLSQSLLPLYFGLDGTKSVDSIEVRWPSGLEQVLPGPLATNRLLTITEPAD